MTRWARLGLLVLILALVGPAAAAEKSFVWWEGEDAAETNFPKRSWFSADTFKDTRHDILSGGDWLSNSGDRKGPEAFARYTVAVPESGEYGLWTRKFWKHGPFRWRFDQGEWRECGRDIALLDTVTIRTHLGANWVFLGRVDLKQGKRKFELRLLAKQGQPLTACFDCFLLSRKSFVPRGKLKPGDKSGQTEPGWWAVEPGPDPFGEALLDLRSLNEEFAGVSGRVHRNGNRFELGDRTEVRFMAVNVGPGVVKLDRDAVTYLARRLAKQGVNMVRIHGPIFDAAAKDPAEVDRTYLGKLHTFVAALKKEGIYTTLSFYFPLWFPIKPGYGIEGYDQTENKKPFSLLYFEPRMQEIYRAWAKTLLTTKNPGTGLSFAKDPAVAIVEIVNEDSLLFHTFDPGRTIPWAQMEKLEKRFRRFAGPGAKKRWDGATHPRDTKTRYGMYSAWQMARFGREEGGRKHRASDQLRFLVSEMKEFYAATAKHFREELGYGGLVSASNWKTADTRLLYPLEQYAYTACDVIDRHGYFGGRHQGEGSNYSVRTGHTFKDRAGVLEPGKLPLQNIEVLGFPQTVTEINWPNPNRFRAEFPFLATVYGAMQGVDGTYFFAVGGAGWDSSVGKFPANVPSVRGQFPACALLYRRGDVREAPVVFREDLGVESLYGFAGGTAVATLGLDELRKSDLPADTALTRGTLDPLTFYVGRVTRAFGKNVRNTWVDEMPGLIDRKNRTVTSATKELRWDLAGGVVTVDTPRCQGATGFLGKRGRIELGDVTIECENEFATILVIALDDRELKDSGKILIQAMTEEKPFGYRTEGNRITDLGGYPLLVRNVEAKVEIRGAANLKKAEVLDLNGYPAGKTPVKMRGTTATVILPKGAMYTILR